MIIPTENLFGELLQYAKDKGLQEISYQDESTKVSFVRNSVEIAEEPLLIPEIEVEEDVFEIVRSPIVGTFRRFHPKDKSPAGLKGTKIKPGDCLGLVECMKIPTEVLSFSNGEIKEVFIEDGHPVEYGQPLFSVFVESKGSTKGKKVI